VLAALGDPSPLPLLQAALEKAPRVCRVDVFVSLQLS
jgi:hypothetical protein